MRSIGPSVVVLLGAVCVAASNPAASLERAGEDPPALRGFDDPAPREGNTAVLALLESAEQERSAGRPEQAAALLERALRIEPRNPTVWHHLGLARLDAGQYAQAEAIAAKSHTLAADDRTLRARNARLTVAALQASGRTLAETNDALQRFALRRQSTAEIEVAGSYVDTGERRSGAEPRRLSPPGGWAQASPAAQSADWRRVYRDYAERVQREARRSEIRAREISARSAAELDRRLYRRSGSNDLARRRR